jgi:hypothetical protein
MLRTRILAGWDADLRALTDGLGSLFHRPEPKAMFGLMVRALLADVPKKNSWGLAEHAGLATPRPFEHLLDGDDIHGSVLFNPDCAAKMVSYCNTGQIDSGCQGVSGVPRPQSTARTPRCSTESQRTNFIPDLIGTLGRP